MEEDQILCQPQNNEDDDFQNINVKITLKFIFQHFSFVTKFVCYRVYGSRALVTSVTFKKSNIVIANF